MTTNKSDFLSLKKRLLETRSLYIDSDFPPELKSIAPTGVPSWDLTIKRIEWKRPVNISRNPKFVSAGATRSDLDQGQVGDCWFIASASILVNGPRQQFERVVPVDQDFEPNSYAGIFRFNFWWYGQWKEIIIDDYLPTDGYRLIFCSNVEDKDEFWGALLEKAYAKLRGSYQGLHQGRLTDALVDMTGGLSETYILKNKKDIPPNLYDLMCKSSQMNSLVGASIELPKGANRPEIRRNNGLVMGHAYSITALSVVPFRGSSVRLLRLRNPWGRDEWQGPWSDKSPEIRGLPMEMKQKLNIVIEEEGEFWISFEDFLANFDEVQLCHLQPDGIAQELARDTNKQNWSVTLYHDAWIKGVTAGGCDDQTDLYWKNPQFEVELKDVDDNRNICTMIVSLMEKEKGGTSNQIAVGFDVYQIRNPQRRPLDGMALSKAELIYKGEKSRIFQYGREVTKRLDFSPGYYVIIPSTYYPHQEADFLLRIYTEKEAKSEVMDEVTKPTIPVTVPRDPMATLFEKYAGDDGKMDYKELRQFLIEATMNEFKEPITFEQETCRSLITLMDNYQKVKNAYYSELTSPENTVSLCSQKVEMFECLKNQSGFLDWEEARVLLKEIKTYTSVFRQFDTNRSNTVDTLELGTMFSKLGFPLSRTVLTSIVRRYGGRDRTLSLDDFITVLCKLVVMFGIFQDQHKKTGGHEDVAQFTRNEFLQYTMFC